MGDDQRTTIQRGTLVASSGGEPIKLAPGVIVDGRYRIEQELGRGGISIVYLARDQKFHGMHVVVKLLLEGLGSHEEKVWFENKFKEEVKALSRITHPGVVRGLDIGELPDGRAYLVMQYVSGVDLRSQISPEGMDFARASRLIRQLALALAGAHEQGVLHRDLKPENIMLQRVADEEYVKIIDFGIATVLDMPAPDRINTTAVAGTVGYMAPEQLLGKPSAASDIYALGVIAYEMLTGRLPFSPNSGYQLLELQRSGVRVKPCDLRPELAEAAQSEILKAVSFKPEDRHESAKAFGNSLADALEAAARVESPDRHAGEAGEPPAQRLLRVASRFQTPGGRTALRLIVALFIIAALAAGRYCLSLSRETPPAGLAAPERRLSYSLTVQRDSKRHPGLKPFSATGGIIFEEGDQVRLNVSASQDGFLYIVNESPQQFMVLFPSTTGNKGSAEISANRAIQIPEPTRSPQMDWFVFDGEEGAEKIWLVWSERSVPELESVKARANPKDGGMIKEPVEIASVAAYLNAQSAIDAEVEEDQAGSRMVFKGRGSLLIGLVKLEHRGTK